MFILNYFFLTIIVMTFFIEQSYGVQNLSPEAIELIRKYHCDNPGPTDPHGIKYISLPGTGRVRECYTKLFSNSAFDGSNHSVVKEVQKANNLENAQANLQARRDKIKKLECTNKPDSGQIDKAGLEELKKIEKECITEIETKRDITNWKEAQTETPYALETTLIEIINNKDCKDLKSEAVKLKKSFDFEKVIERRNKIVELNNKCKEISAKARSGRLETLKSNCQNPVANLQLKKKLTADPMFYLKDGEIEMLEKNCSPEGTSDEDIIQKGLFDTCIQYVVNCEGCDSVTRGLAKVFCEEHSGELKQDNIDKFLSSCQNPCLNNPPESIPDENYCAPPRTSESCSVPAADL